MRVLGGVGGDFKVSIWTSVFASAELENIRVPTISLSSCFR